MCLCETKYQGGGGLAPFWGSAKPPEKVSRDMGYRSDSIAVSRDMGPLRAAWKGLNIEQCQMVVFVADDLGFWGPGILDLITELCPPQDTA